jgi:hypothetical protein
MEAQSGSVSGSRSRPRFLKTKKKFFLSKTDRQNFVSKNRYPWYVWYVLLNPYKGHSGPRSLQPNKKLIDMKLIPFFLFRQLFWPAWIRIPNRDPVPLNHLNPDTEPWIPVLAQLVSWSCRSQAHFSNQKVGFLSATKSDGPKSELIKSGFRIRLSRIEKTLYRDCFMLKIQSQPWFKIVFVLRSFPVLGWGLSCFCGLDDKNGISIWIKLKTVPTVLFTSKYPWRNKVWSEPFGTLSFGPDNINIGAKH